MISSIGMHCLKRCRRFYQQTRWFSSEISISMDHADILYLDHNYCIVNKPANVCIDGEDEITMEKVTTATLDEMQHPYKQKIRHCHQLDKNTSGILIYGLNRNSTKKMNQIIQKRNLNKTYYAIVHAHIKDINHFILDLPISDNDHHPKRVAIGNNKKEGRACITQCWVIKCGYFKQFPVTLLRIKLYTGRKHQIRAHLSHIGFPIVGDSVYSDDFKYFDRMYLDSHGISVTVNMNNVHKQINVNTNTDKVFGELVSNQDQHIVNIEYDNVFMIDHQQYNYSMIVPFVMNKDKNDIKILVKKMLQYDNVNYNKKKGPRSQSVGDNMCWSFVCESRLKEGFCDIPQNIARNLLKEYEHFGRYLYTKSLFCPEAFECSLRPVIKGSGKDNLRYLTHHLASNIRRNNRYHCTVLCAPYVVYLVPFTYGILNDQKQIKDAKDNTMQWVAMNDLMHNGSQSVDQLLRVVLMNKCISSMSWLRNPSENVLTLNLDWWKLLTSEIQEK